MYPIGISADIEKAFLMLSVAPKDRDFLRFFYPCNDVELIYRHCRIVFGVSSSPFLLNATIMHLLENCTEFYDVVQKLKCSFYVDNCLTGVHNVSEAEDFIEKAKLIMAKGCFNLRGWESNVECKHASKHSGNTSVLGIIWNLDEDTLKCKIDFEILSCETKITKIFILSTVQKFYDPLGMLIPSTLLPKLILQDLWKSHFSWEEELPFTFVDKFSKWLNEMYLLKDVTLPRFMNFNETSELHVFVDACKGAYAACVFVRSEVEGESKVRLIRAKNRVAPLKSLSIPRLELMACCIGARLVNSVIKAIDASSIKVTLWSDSTVALWWIKEYGDWSVFVANRVKEVRELTGCYSWRHVPGNMNIADLLSRGCTPQQMLNSKWWEGPSWLKENPESWPVRDIICQPKEVDIEKRKSKLVNMNLTEDTPPWYAERLSDYDKMIRVFTWILRFVNICKLVNGKCKDSELSQSEIEYSEKKLIRLVQSYYFSNAKSSNFIETFLDNEGILRVKTKIINRNDDRSFLYPILLPEKCEFTKLLIRTVHRKNCHAGIQMMQCLLREKYWIIRARKAIKNVLYNCVICKRFKIKSMSSEPTPLPPDRVTDCAPFEIVGIELAGPLFLKNEGKVWIVLFTCAVYHAIHLELVNSLSSDAFLLALRRFIARRGRPRTIYCDNGTNFRGASNDLSKLNWSKILKETRTPKIFWKFIPPTAAWC
ncbi:hypothetical protein AVEN_164489-1 [Araneus ventricosus]|uniref:Integrase zinc-binding domain-containing protein n=1 Tax=Araneus ventricosus TaxID=182803 RepID=A0A4Y2IPG5_ARAVE|nr:hypothetical protein AVEN_164489-1 [Araneus ventricosus]